MADQLLTNALTWHSSSKRCALGYFASRIEVSNCFPAMTHRRIDANHSITKLLLISRQGLCKSLWRADHVGFSQEKYGSAHRFCRKACASNLHRKLQATAQRKLSKIDRSFSKPSNFLSGHNEADAVWLILDQLPRGCQARRRVTDRKGLREYVKASASERQLVRKPKSNYRIEPASVSPLSYQWSKQSNQHANHGPHGSPCIPPNDAAILSRRPARAYCIPPAHSLIPLWTGRHSAMATRPEEFAHG